jgi:glycerol-3-phosphate acyltransferase PlsX
VDNFTPTISYTKKITIALDAMGGDFGPEVVIPGAERFLSEHADIQFLIFGDQTRIRPCLDRTTFLKSAARVIHTDKTIANDDKPSAALRKSKDTSMRLAIEAVANNEADAIVSAGNTGALMAMAKLILKSLPGIHRPAIASLIPAPQGDTIMLDMGANVLVDAENLVQFAVLGSIFAKAHKDLQTPPTVGLLNVGSEDSKGPEHVKGASAILETIDFPGRYKGFVEGTDILNGVVDVIVCDGYVGNIALKTMEGTAKTISHQLKKAITSDPLAIIGTALSYFALRRFKKKVDPRLYNGGVFLGLGGLCIKSHGGTDDLGFASAIRLAYQLAQAGYISQVVEEIQNLMIQEPMVDEA